MNAATFDQAIDKLRAAQLRRQLASEGSSTFVHAPRPAWVPSEAENAWQRSFGTDNYSAICGLQLRDAESGRMSISVLRSAKKEVARLEIALGATCHVRALLDPAELRDLAARLIDAAHDIEAHPAAELQAEREAA